MASKTLQYTGDLYKGWRQDLINNLGTGPGVYLAKRGDRLLYVGRAKNLASRLATHTLNWISVDPELVPDHFEIIDTRFASEAADLEADLIAKHRPPLNRRLERRSVSTCPEFEV